jgi:hypothetical protein
MAALDFTGEEHGCRPWRSPPFRGVPRSTLVFVDRRAARPDLLDQREQRAAERHELRGVVPAQHVGRYLEEGFGGDVGVDDPPVGRDAAAPGCGSALSTASGRPSVGTVIRGDAHAAAVMRQHSRQSPS